MSMIWGPSGRGAGATRLRGCCVAVLSAFMLALPGQAHAEVNHSQVLFQGCGGVWRMDYDGQAQRFVRDGDGLLDGGLSPNGQEYVGASDITLIGIDGRARGTLFQTPATGTMDGLSYGPDGRSFYFGYQEDATSGVYARDIVRLRKGEETPTTVIGWPGDQIHPAVSPDGSKIAFFSDTRPDGSYIGSFFHGDEDGWLYVANLDGSNPQLIVGPDHIRSGRFPSWSPDGSKILFNSVDLNLNWELSVVNATGTGYTTIDESPDYIYSGAWLSNSRIAYPAPTGQVVAVDTNGTNRSVLVDDNCFGDTIATRTASSSLDETDFLAANFRPLLFFDSNEPWRPLNVDQLLLEDREGHPGEANHVVENLSGSEPLRSTDQLRTWATGAWIKLNVDADPTVTWRYRSPDSACWVGVLQDCNEGPATTLYYHVTPETMGGYRYIDYWWLYRYNDATAIDQHEADWEGLTVAPSKTIPSTFDFISYAQHTNTNNYPSNYLRTELQCDDGDSGSCGTNAAPRGQRAWAFVADGSHATYPNSCDNGCFQSNGVPEFDHDGDKEWGSNYLDPVDGSLTEFPEPRGWNDSTVGNWVDWPGKWGAKVDGDTHEPGTVDSPGNQPRFKCPWHEWDGEPQACPSATAHASRGASAEACPSWFGQGIAALACDPKVLRRAVSRGRLSGRGQLSLRTVGRRWRVGSAPGLAQAMGQELHAGSRVEVRGRASRRLQVAVRIHTGRRHFRAIFSHVRLGKRRRGVITVLRGKHRPRVVLRAPSLEVQRPRQLTRTGVRRP